jgi:hypothetical protein
MSGSPPPIPVGRLATKLLNPTCNTVAIGYPDLQGAHELVLIYEMIGQYSAEFQITYGIR